MVEISIEYKKSKLNGIVLLRVYAMMSMQRLMRLYGYYFVCSRYYDMYTRYL